ncbi:PREDICTED: RING-H2 finger protein ATL22-like [Prunus mume]|uniref:RING-type E3 ubiquitin transferase n=1 Tax=Prunus mume TaxID=102107 RepID=A0ABM0PG18_PRUMU|nr:PREDICTED: RING-H2 finger protein ATL22-like [Prunus mume]
MPALKEYILISFLLFFFFIPHLAATSSATTCGESTCTSTSPQIRFPFWLKNLQPSTCGYEGFGLTCNPGHRWQSILITVPSSSRHFAIQEIDYLNQNVWISDPNNCFPRRFMDNDFSFDGSPFSYVHALERFTFLNCSYQAEVSYPPISCLSNEHYMVTGVPSDLINSSTPWSSCSVISEAWVPLSEPFESFEWDYLNGFELEWYVPNCRFCEAIPGKVCGFDNNTSSKLGCSNAINSTNGLSKTVMYGKICIGITGLFFLVIVIMLRLRACGRVNRPIIELSAIPHPQPSAVIMGLDDPTIDSYPKTQLGESLELPKPNDNTCSICLGNYQPRETLRTIPECNHYFHANCIDEWLRRNATCPICRKSSEGNKGIEA